MNDPRSLSPPLFSIVSKSPLSHLTCHPFFPPLSFYPASFISYSLFVPSPLPTYLLLFSPSFTSSLPSFNCIFSLPLSLHPHHSFPSPASLSPYVTSSYVPPSLNPHPSLPTVVLHPPSIYFVSSPFPSLELLSIYIPLSLLCLLLSLSLLSSSSYILQNRKLSNL